MEEIQVLIEDPDEIVLLIEAPAPEGGGTGDHNALTNKDLADQHPMSAITGLSSAITSITTTAQSALNEAETANETAQAAASAASSASTAASQAQTTASNAQNTANSALTKASTDPLPLFCSDTINDIVANASISKIRYVFQEVRTLSAIPVGELTVTAPVGGSFTVDIKKNGVSILSTLLTFDSGENTTRTAAIPAVLASSPITFNIGDYVEVFVTAVGSVTPGKGLLIVIPLNK